MHFTPGYRMLQFCELCAHFPAHAYAPTQAGFPLYLSKQLELPSPGVVAYFVHEGLPRQVGM